MRKTYDNEPNHREMGTYYRQKTSSESACQYARTHKNIVRVSGHHRSTSETPFKCSHSNGVSLAGR